MSLYVNKQVEPKVHLSTYQLNGSNQGEYRLHFLAEVLKSQDNINQKLTDSIESFSNLFQSTNSDQQEQNFRIEAKIEGQNITHKNILNNLEKLEAIIKEKLEQINGNQQELVQLVDKDEMVHQAIFAQLCLQDQSTISLIQKLIELENVSRELSDHVKNQLNSQNKITYKLEVQDVYHQTVMERLDQQEAITHKINRQLDSLKAVIFERIGHLAEKIDTQSKQTIKSLTGLFFKTEVVQPIEKKTETDLVKK